MVKKYSEVYEQTRKRLMASEPEFADMAAKELVCHYSGKSPEKYLLERNLYASEEFEVQVAAGVRRYLAGEPLPYIIEEWDFGGMTLHVTKDTLIPRDDTLVVAELALEALRKIPSPRILDLCCGTGCIGLFLAKELKSCTVFLGDISSEALAVARKNVLRHGLSSRVSCVRLDAFTEPPAFLRDFDLVVSNPPYITDSEMEELSPSVRDYEPHLALRGGVDGLDFYRAISKNYCSVLKPEGILCFEFGMGQENDICEIIGQCGWKAEIIKKDTNEIYRALLARKVREEA